MQNRETNKLITKIQQKAGGIQKKKRQTAKTPHKFCTDH